MASLRILTLLARYGTTAYPDADRKIDAILRERVPGVERHMVIVDNALPSDYVSRPAENCELIGGTGIWREFSGFDDAHRHLGERIFEFDVILLATAAYDQYYTGYIHRMSETMLELARDYPVAIGHIDAYPYMIGLFGFESQYWIRSSFVLVSPWEATRVLPFAFANDRQLLFSRNSAKVWSDTVPLSNGYRKLITNWLTSAEGTGQGAEWHSRFDLTRDTFTLFQDKAIAIINEHMLTVRLRAQGCRIVDQTWLAAHLEAGRPLPPAWPGWRAQLAARDEVPAQPAASVRPI